MSTKIQWLHFEATTLQKAAALDRPVLMVLVVPWCSFCRSLQQDVLARDEVVHAVQDSVVAVLVDAERRPDINQRFGAGSWPTIAWLTPEGELLAQDGYLAAPALLQRIAQVSAAWYREKEQIRSGLRGLWAERSEREAAKHTRLSPEIVDEVALAIYDKLDHRHGGFGETSKFPHPEAIDFALVQASKRGDARMREVVTLTLQGMLQGPMQDRVAGGFFRYSRTADWCTPNFEKLLDQNALVLRACLEAYQVFGDRAYRDACTGIVDWMTGCMLDRDSGAFWGSQAGTADYYRANAEQRKAQSAPTLDRTIYCHANSIAASTLFKAAAVLGEPGLAQIAQRAVTFLLERLYDGRDVYHYWDGTYHLPGMLADQAHMIRALIDASQHTGDADLLRPAEAIAERALARHKAPSGGFYDILPSTGVSGPMMRRNRSILDNATMAESLMRLSSLARRGDFYDEAVGALEAFAEHYKEYGYYVAGYGRAVDLLFYEPLFVTIVGSRDDARTSALRSAALSLYVPSRIVQTLDPTHDPILLGRSGLPKSETPVVYFSVGKRADGCAHTPEAVRQEMERIERQRRSAGC